jgi:hypothetical protein
MNHYHALISTGDPEDIHKRISLDAKSLSHAKELFEAAYGLGKIVSRWGDYEASKPRGNAGRDLSI